MLGAGVARLKIFLLLLLLFLHARPTLGSPAARFQPTPWEIGFRQQPSGLPCCFCQTRPSPPRPVFGTNGCRFAVALFAVMPVIYASRFIDLSALATRSPVALPVPARSALLHNKRRPVACDCKLDAVA